jgi:hypothetical protein
MSCEFAGVHEVWQRVRAIIELISFVVQELHDALRDALDRLGRDLGGGAPDSPERSRSCGRGVRRPGG